MKDSHRKRKYRKLQHILFIFFFFLFTVFFLTSHYHFFHAMISSIFLFVSTFPSYYFPCTSSFFILSICINFLLSYFAFPIVIPVLVFYSRLLFFLTHLSFCLYSSSHLYIYSLRPIFFPLSSECGSLFYFFPFFPFTSKKYSIRVCPERNKSRFKDSYGLISCVLVICFSYSAFSKYEVK